MPDENITDVSLARQETLDQRATVWTEMTRIMDEAGSGELTAEQRQSYSRAEAEFERLTEAARTEHTHAVRRKMMEAPAGQQVRHESAGGTGSLRSSQDENERRYANAFSRFIRYGESRLNDLDRRVLEGGWVDLETRDQSAGTAAAGGYTVPQGFRATMIEAQKKFGGLRALAGHLDTETGNDLPMPTNDDTGNIGEIINENTTVTFQDLTFGQVTMKAYIYSSKGVLVSRVLLNDNAVNLDQYIPRKLGERIGRIQAQHFITGTGTGQPKGLITGIGAAVTGGAGVFVPTFDNLIDLI